MNNKFKTAFNVVAKYGFCRKCRLKFDSKQCHESDCYEYGVKRIREALEIASEVAVKRIREALEIASEVAEEDKHETD